MHKTPMDSKKKHVVIVDKMSSPNNVTFVSEVKVNEPHEATIGHKDHKKMSMNHPFKAPKSPHSSKGAVIKAAIKHDNKDSNKKPDDHALNKNVIHGSNKDHHPVHPHKKRHTVKHHEIPVHPKPVWEKPNCEELCSCNADCTECEHKNKKNKLGVQEKKPDLSKVKKITRTKSEPSQDARSTPSQSGAKTKAHQGKSKRQSTHEDSNTSDDSQSSNDTSYNSTVDLQNDDEDIESCVSLEKDGDEDSSSNSSEIIPLKIEKGFQPKVIQPPTSPQVNKQPNTCKCIMTKKYEPEPQRVRICCCPEAARIQAELREWKGKVALMEKELSNQKDSVRKFTAQLFALTTSLQAINRFKDTMDINLSTLLFIASRRGEIQEFYEPELVAPIFKRINDELMIYLTKFAKFEPNPPNSDEHDKTCLLLTLAANILAAKKTWDFFTTQSSMVDLLYNMFIALGMIQNVPSLQKMELILMKIMYSLTIHVETYMLVQQQHPILKCICKYIRMDHHHFKRYFGLQFAERVTRYIRDKETYSLIIKTLPMRVIDFYADLEPNQEATDVQIISENIIKQVKKNHMKLFPHAGAQSYKAHMCYPSMCPLIKDQAIYLREKEAHSMFPGLDEQLKTRLEREEASYFKNLADKHDELLMAKADLVARGKVLGRTDAQNQKKSFSLNTPTDSKDDAILKSGKIVQIHNYPSFIDYSLNGGSIHNNKPSKENWRRATSLQSKIVHVIDRFEPVLTVPRSVTDEFFTPNRVRQSSGDYIFLYKGNPANATSQDLVLVPFHKKSNDDDYIL